MLNPNPNEPIWDYVTVLRLHLNTKSLAQTLYCPQGVLFFNPGRSGKMRKAIGKDGYRVLRLPLLYGANGINKRSVPELVRHLGTDGLNQE